MFELAEGGKDGNLPQTENEWTVPRSGSNVSLWIEYLFQPLNLEDNPGISVTFSSGGLLKGCYRKKPYVTSDQLLLILIQIALYLLVVQGENLTEHQESLRALFHALLQLDYLVKNYFR